MYHGFDRQHFWLLSKRQHRCHRKEFIIVYLCLSHIQLLMFAPTPFVWSRWAPDKAQDILLLIESHPTNPKVWKNGSTTWRLSPWLEVTITKKSTDKKYCDNVCANRRVWNSDAWSHPSRAQFLLSLAGPAVHLKHLAAATALAGWLATWQGVLSKAIVTITGLGRELRIINWG